MSASAPAQFQPNCLANEIWYFPDPVPFGWTILGPAQGPFSFIIGTWSFLCVPPRAPSPCHHGSASAANTAGNPIALCSGNTFIDETDIKIPGLGGGLSLMRTWNSDQPPPLGYCSLAMPGDGGYSSCYVIGPGIFGGNWRSTYEERIYTGNDGYLTYLRSDGTSWAWGWDSSSSLFRVAAPANVAATFSQVNSHPTITFQNGEQRQFDNVTGNLVAIVDRNGNTTSIAYDTYGRLSTVTDPASRTLTFNYPNPSSTIVTSVSSSVGISVSYTYSGNVLTQVTEQDLSTLKFTYGGALSLITEVTDSQGKVIESHTYDGSGRGLSSSKANGVESVTITYP